MVIDFSSQTDSRKFHLRRLVFDYRLGRFTRGEGQAIWQSDGILAESLRFGAVEAHRRFIWRQVEDRFDIAYDTGEPLVTFRVDGVTAAHLCGRDLYEARLYAYDRLEIGIGWRVRGPAKDYAMVTLYRADKGMTDR